MPTWSIGGRRGHGGIRGSTDENFDWAGTSGENGDKESSETNIKSRN